MTMLTLVDFPKYIDKVDAKFSIVPLERNARLVCRNGVQRQSTDCLSDKILIDGKDGI